MKPLKYRIKEELERLFHRATGEVAPHKLDPNLPWWNEEKYTESERGDAWMNWLDDYFTYPKERKTSKTYVKAKAQKEQARRPAKIPKNS